MFKTKLLGRLGVWLCNRYTPRPLTKVEIAESDQYVGLMIDVLRGEVPYYGRDRKFGTGCGEMSEMATRAKELADKVNETCVYHYKPALNVADTAELIEQALLAERRLAMESCAEIAVTEEVLIPIADWNGPKRGFGIKLAHGIAAAIRRAAAEKEVGK